MLSKIPLWTWKPKLWPSNPCQNLGDNSYSSDSHCTEDILPQTDIVLTQWSSLPKMLVRWRPLWGWQSLYRTQPELPGSKGKMFCALPVCDRLELQAWEGNMVKSRCTNDFHGCLWVTRDQAIEFVGSLELQKTPTLFKQLPCGWSCTVEWWCTEILEHVSLISSWELKPSLISVIY